MQRIYYHYAALAGFFGLFFLLMAWPTLIAPNVGLPKALLLIVSVGPLLLPFKGFLTGRLKSCTWMSYLSLPYLVHGIIEAYADPIHRSFAFTEVLFSLLLCFGAGYYVYTAEKR